MMEITEAIESIKVHTFKPGDIVAIVPGRVLSEHEVFQMQEGLSGILPDGVKGVVLDYEMDIKVLRSEDE